jgi:chromosome segregation ATPase
MQLDSLIPRDSTTLLYVVIASILAWLGGWFTRRRREPVELDKLKAETKSIHITAETAEINLGRELMREMQTIVDKAEKRREEWHLKEEQMRGQIIFWRNKSEELDGKLADAQEVVWKMQSEMESYENQIRTMNATLTIGHKNYDNTQDTKPEDYTLPPKSE